MALRGGVDRSFFWVRAGENEGDGDMFALSPKSKTDVVEVGPVSPEVLGIDIPASSPP